MWLYSQEPYNLKIANYCGSGYIFLSLLVFDVTAVDVSVVVCFYLLCLLIFIFSFDFHFYFPTRSDVRDYKMPRRKTTRRSRRKPKEEGVEGNEGGGGGGGEGGEGQGAKEGGRLSGEGTTAPPDGEHRLQGGEGFCTLAVVIGKSTHSRSITKTTRSS